jgi:hypothetical protein
MVRTLNQDFFKKWSPEMAYVLGFFAADGSMLENKRGGCFVEFNITDRIVLEYIQKASGSNHKITERTHDARNNVQWKQLYRLQIGSKVWFTDLSALGFTQRKSNTLKFPEVPSAYFGHFVRGYFDGDGCVYLGTYIAKDRKKERWVFQTLFTSGSKVFLEELHLLLIRYGVRGGRIAKKSKGAYELILSWRDSLALYRLMYHTVPVCGPYLPRKREKLEKGIKVLALDK